MAKIQKLTALEVRQAGPGRHGDGGGLWLTVRGDGAKSWSFRYTRREKRREMGLGSIDDYSLEEAREAARDARKLLDQGIDPIDERRRKLREVVPTFRECAEQYIKSHKAGWSSTKHAKQWEATLKTYAYPHIGTVPVDQIETEDVFRLLESIWETKTETASRVRGRVEQILDWATVLKYRDGRNPARWRGTLNKLLPKPSDVRVVKHHRALPWQEVGAFMRDLRQREGMGARALEFAILTAARSGEVRGATWAEIDTDGKVWVVPPSKMKAGKEHRVPLPDQAVKLLEALPRFEDTDLVFPSAKRRKISDMTLSAVCRRMGADCVPHGFRSSFRDWCSEATRYPREVAEMALAHSIGDKTEAAYRRGDLFAKRTKLMEEWADYCDRVPAKGKGDVVAIRAAP